VAVVGAGLPALAAALELARRGAWVVVVGTAAAEERPRGLGAVLLGPGRPYAGLVRLLGRPLARLVWAAGCESHLRLRSVLGEARRDCGYSPRGSFLLATDRAQAEALAESEDLLREDGFPGEFLDHYMLETRFDLSGFPGAYWAAEDAEVDARLLLGALGEQARSAGVAFDPRPVRAVRAEAGGRAEIEVEGAIVRAAAALVATDGPARALVPGLGPLVRPAASARLRTVPLAGAVLPAVVRTADGRVAWHSAADAVLLAATGPAAEAASIETFATRIPVDVASARPWDEEGEVSADGLPLVGRLPGSALAVACGFGAFPAGLAFAAARWVTDALLGGADPTPEPLRAARPPRPAGAV
jgi:glycine/D-amino acid oxidase-like deaminating enzyme